jgi:hypothetical protein
MNRECSLKHSMPSAEIERLCCLYALGELAPEEYSRIEAHIGECVKCETLAREFNRLVLFDLPGVAIAKIGEAESDQASQVDHRELLAGIHEKAHAIALKSAEAWGGALPAESSRLGMKVLRFKPTLARLSYAAGWAAAAILFVGYFAISSSSRTGAIENTNPVVASKSPAADSSRLLSNPVQESELRAALAHAEQHVRDSHAANAVLTSQLQSLSSDNDSLRTQLAAEKAKTAEDRAQLEFSRQTFNELLAAKESLQNQLADMNERMEKRNAELASLSRAAAVVPVSYPVAEQTIGVGEAKEILGARDLHIVDVYDLDGSGKSSRAYGRIYYVNHDQLIFYAFDLGKLERDHKVVAFQAWGFRQPKSTQVESLGLFYLDNAPLNRWTLKVSDPQILARIDTLFVTAEPPGGSRFPKGKRLLMASLAGPPNHP